MKIPHFEFSKIILIFESILVWQVSHKVLYFIELAISNSFTGTLPYLVTFITVVFGAYGTSVSFYYNKAKTENTIKLTNVVNATDDSYTDTGVPSQSGASVDCCDFSI